jgi:hypothetical protein
VVRKILVAGIGLTAALALASCGSSGKAGGSSGIQSVSPSANASATTATTATPTATMTATSAPADTKPCSNADLKVTASGDNDGAAGTIVQRFLITNTSSKPCTMKGRPSISPFGLMKQGTTKVQGNIDIKVDPIPANFGDLGGAAALRTVAPGGTTVFFLKWSQVPVDNNTCPVADGFEFQPPQGAGDNYLPITYKFTPCGPSMQVSNVLPSSTGS